METEMNRALLRKHALRATPGRLAILQELERVHIPLSAEAIRASIRMPALDLVTVYRSLTSFERAGIVRRADFRTDAAVFELVRGHHHHIVCTQCGDIEDFIACDMDHVSQKIARSAKRFSSIEEHSLELFGVCNLCKK